MNTRSKSTTSYSYFSQTGQVLPVGIALIMFSVLFFLVLFNTGQMASEKSRLANTADAAVYSGLVWQARALNFQAYSNRAMVANQVSIAQVVSLTSWTNYGRITARNIHAAIGWIPFVGAYTRAAKEIMTQIEEVMRLIAEVVVPVIDGVNQALSESQQLIYTSTFAATPNIVKEVVEANDKRYNVESDYAIGSLGLNSLNWKSFTRRYDDIEGLERKASVINRSKDKFTRDRGWSMGRFYITPVNRITLVKEGTTRLVNDISETTDHYGHKTLSGKGEWAWKAKDNFSIHAERWRCSLSGCRWRRTEVPIGWGGAYVQNDIEPCDSIEDNYYSGEGGSGAAQKKCPRWMQRNSLGEKLSDKEALKIDAKYSGLQAYFDLRDLSETNKDPRLTLRVEVQVNESTVRTSDNIAGLGSNAEPTEATRKSGFGQGAFWTGNGPSVKTMSSVASGEVFFERPLHQPEDHLRVNGRVKTEYGSLFNPYWQVRLVETSRDQKLAAWLVDSPQLASAASTGSAVGVQHYSQQQQQELGQLTQLQRYTQDQLSHPAQLITQEQQQVKNSLAAVDAQIYQLQNNIVASGNSGASAQIIAEQQQRLTKLQNTRSQLQQQFTNIPSQIQSQLQNRVSALQNQVVQTQQQINQAGQGIVQRFSNDLSRAQSTANQIKSSSLARAYESLRQNGEHEVKEALRNAVTDKVKDSLKNAVVSITNHYGGDVQQRAETAYRNVEDTLNTVYRQQVQPIRDQITGMQQQVNNIEASMRAEYESTSKRIQEEIAHLSGSIDNEVAQLESQLQSELNVLTEQRAVTTVLYEQISLDEKITLAQSRLSTEPSQRRTELQSRVDGLIKQREQLVESFQENLDRAVGDIESEIASLEQQISLLEEHIK